MTIDSALEKYGRFFIIPLDHPKSDDVKQLMTVGTQGLIDTLDDFDHDGYIIHARDLFTTSIQTKKDFFVTVGEATENYLAEFDEVVTKVTSKKVTIFFEVKTPDDVSALSFYGDFTKKLKQAGFLIMAMGFPSEDAEGNCYPQIVKVAQALQVDILKTDYYDGISSLDFGSLKLCIGGGPLLDDKSFQTLVTNVVSLKDASFSFGRNIHEAANYAERIQLILKQLGR